VLLVCYLLTLAPGVTYWDAGEFIVAAHGLGIPHPPGTPLYVALGRVWTLAFSGVMGPARAMNLLSAVATASAGALTAWLVSRETRVFTDARWGAAAGALIAGLMATSWSNATETEVYAVSLLHAVALLFCAARAGERDGSVKNRWMIVTAYLVALAPAVHLGVLVAAPAAMVLASRRGTGGWRLRPLLVIGGALLMSAGVGRVSAWLVIVGAGLVLASVASRDDDVTADRAAHVRAAMAVLALVAVAASALVIMLVRAKLDPPLNQGNPATLSSLADVVARRQYAVAGLFPRQAPVWLQLANVVQYVDWQAALGWGRGVFTTPWRVLATGIFVALGMLGARALLRDAPRLAAALLVLLGCGTLGVAVYLNLKAGASLGWGVLPDSAPHEARERDYFFALGFWAWGALAGYGGLWIARARRWPAPAALAFVAIPLIGNWRVSDRSREPRASAAAVLAASFLDAAPPRAVLFTGGDNDSYPLWYAQQVDGRRPDVTVVTISLLPATWYQAEIARRTGLRWASEPAPPARMEHERVMARIARAARRAGRPVTATPAVTAAERSLLGGGWRLEGVVYRSWAPADGARGEAWVNEVVSAAWSSRAPDRSRAGPVLVDDVAAQMSEYLACPLLYRPDLPFRDSLEVRCNLR
jgi:hypothetical protein